MALPRFRMAFCNQRAHTGGMPDTLTRSMVLAQNFCPLRRLLGMLDYDIHHESPLTKYQQLADGIMLQIERGELGLGDRLPSVNKLSKSLDMSRETVFRALAILSDRGIVESSNRRGYFVKNTTVKIDYNILFLLDKFTTFKDDLYNAFHAEVGQLGKVDVYFHHHNFAFFSELIRSNLNKYTHFVITTYLREDPRAVLNLIPPEKRVIVDRFERGLEGDFGMVYQDFGNSLHQNLHKALPRLKHYRGICLVASSELYHYESITQAFAAFGDEHQLATRIIPRIDSTTFEPGWAYLTFTHHDTDEVNLIKLARGGDLQLGRDVGLISYNDTPVKEILEGGITVISADFAAMGRQAAHFILNRSHGTVVTPSKLIMRKSL